MQNSVTLDLFFPENFPQSKPIIWCGICVKCPKVKMHCCLPQVNLNNEASGLYDAEISMFICIQSRMVRSWGRTWRRMSMQGENTRVELCPLVIGSLRTGF